MGSIAAAVLAATALYVALDAPLAALELRLIAAAQAATGPVASSILDAASVLHAPRMILAATGVVALLLAWRRERALLPWFLAVVVGGITLNAILKHVFERARPSLDALASRVGDFSFPSGHTAAATVFYGSLALILWSRRPDPAARAVIAVSAAALVLVVAASRVVAGAHYPTDVLAAIAEGVAWLALCTAAWRRAGDRRGQAA